MSGAVVIGLLTAWLTPPAASANDVNAAAVVPLRQAHAHNDYHHKRPLLDALDRGFCSVEADIYLVNDKLLVGHFPWELRPQRTLENLYLKPLRERIKENDGRVHRGTVTMTLLIDIKTDGPATYAVLRRKLAAYRDILTAVERGKPRQGAVQVVISGNCPRTEIKADEVRYASIDGRLGDLDSKTPAHLMPLISDRWTSHFRWRGKGKFPNEERRKLQAIVQRAHAAGRRVRFWATPESLSVWRELVAAKVDHINTDRLDDLRDFLLPPQASVRE